MPQINVIESYLVSLGFIVDQPTFRRFTTALQAAGNAVTFTTETAIKDLLKWQTAIVAAFTSISGAVIGTVDAVAKADQEYRLFGIRMMVTTENARNLKLALDAIGQPLELIALDPELHERFMQLYGPGGDLDKLMAILGPDFEVHQKRVRDLQFEITKLGLAFKVLAMAFADKVFVALQPEIEAIIKKFQEWFDYIVNHGPEIADYFAKNLVPILRDTWEIWKAIGEAIKEFSILFVNVIAIFSGNDGTLKTTTFSFEKLAYAIRLVAHFLRDVVLVGADAAHVISLILQGKFAEANKMMLEPKYFKDEPTFASTQGGASTGAIAEAGGAASSPVGTNAQQAAALAARVGQKTGIDPRLIFEQWAFETGGFTSNAFKNLNNMGGIRYPGTSVYEKYGSLDEFANRYAQVITGSRYKGLPGAHTEQEFSSILKRGGYYESDQPHYGAGMQRYSGAYTDASTHIDKIEVNVGRTNATAHDIASEMSKELSRRQQLTQAQLAPGVY